MNAKSLMATLLLIPALASSPAFREAPTAISATDASLAVRHGTLYRGEKPFTGIVVDSVGDGAVVRQSTEYLDGLRDGDSRAWYSGNRLAWERAYRHSKEIGTHRGWWANGAPHFVYHYRNGIIEGTAREWFANGRLYREFHYQAGQESGSERMWYADGSLRANYVMRDGRRFGLPGSKGCTGADSTGTGQ